MADISTILGVAEANVASIAGVSWANVASVDGVSVPAGGGGLSTPVLVAQGIRDSVLGTTIETGSWTPAAGSLLLVVSGGQAGGTRTLDSVTSGFTTGGWTIFATSNFTGAGNKVSFECAWANYTSGTGTVTATWSANQRDAHVAVFEVTGHNTTTPIINIVVGNSEGATSHALTLAAPGAGGITFGGMSINANTPIALTAGTGYTEIFGVDTVGGGTGADVRLQAQYDETTPGTNFDWSGTASGANCAFGAFELQAA